MGGKKKYIEMLGSFTEPFSCLLWIPISCNCNCNWSVCDCDWHFHLPRKTAFGYNLVSVKSL